MNITDTANAFSVVNRDKVIFINLSTYLGKDKAGEKQYSNFTGVIFKKNASEYLVAQAEALEAALEEADSVAVSIEGYLHALDTSTDDNENVYPKLEVNLTKLRGTQF